MGVSKEYEKLLSAVEKLNDGYYSCSKFSRHQETSLQRLVGRFSTLLSRASRQGINLLLVEKCAYYLKH